MIKKKKTLKKIPKFRNENEERKFWATHDSTEHIDWSKGFTNPVFPNLKPSTKMISLRLPLNMLYRLKEISNKKDIPYQSYIKVILDERIRQEDRY